MRKLIQTSSIEIRATAVVFVGRPSLTLLWLYSNYCKIYFSGSLTFRADDVLSFSAIFSQHPRPKEIIILLNSYVQTT
jgi:hypothetical protein